MSLLPEDVHDEIVAGKFPLDIMVVKTLDITPYLSFVGGNEREEGVIVALTNSHQHGIFDETPEL